MAVTVVQVGTMNQYTTPTATPTLASNVTVGNSVIMIAQSYSAVAVSTVTGCGVTWQRAISGVANVGVSGSIDIWYGVRSTGGSLTATVTFNGGNNNYALLVECSPILFDKAAKVENVTGVPLTPSLVPTQAGGICIGSLAVSAGSTYPVAPWTRWSNAGGYQSQCYNLPTDTSAQQLTVTGSVSATYSGAIASFLSVPVEMGIKYYTSEDFGSALQVVNVLDPSAPQDVATKHYTDAHAPTPFHGQILWETAYNMACGANSYTGAYAALSTGPNVQTITKRRADTGIKVKMGTSCYSNVGGTVSYAVVVNGSPISVLFTYYINVAVTHCVMPWAVQTLWPSSFSQVGVTGNMNVVFYISTQAGLTWNTDSGDVAGWTIAEVMP